MKKYPDNKIDKTNIMFYNLLSRENINFIIEQTIGSKGKALDLGAGIGFISNALSFNYEVFAVDKNIESLAYIRKKYGIKTYCANILKEPIPDGQYDLILLSEVIEEIPIDNHLNFLKDICNSLKPGGKFIITTPSNDGLIKIKNPIYSYNKGGYNFEELIELIEKTGMKIVKAKYNMIFFSRLIMELQKLFISKSTINGVQSELNNLRESLLFKTYKLFFPIIYFLSKIDRILPNKIKGTGITISAIKKAE